jgi:uncharacterized RDD family membrane protein YckC
MADEHDETMGKFEPDGGEDSPSGQSAYLPPSWAEPPSDDPTTGDPFAGFGWRVGGFLIDTILLAVVLSLVLRPLGSLLLQLIVGAVLRVIYNATFMAKWNGQTPGMRLMKITCVDAETRGMITMNQSLTRAATAEVIASLNFFMVILGVAQLVDLLWPLWDKQDQTLHDKVGRTVVVRPLAEVSI